MLVVRVFSSSRTPRAAPRGIGGDGGLHRFARGASRGVQDPGCRGRRDPQGAQAPRRPLPVLHRAEPVRAHRLLGRRGQRRRDPQGRPARIRGGAGRPHHRHPGPAGQQPARHAGEHRPQPGGRPALPHPRHERDPARQRRSEDHDRRRAPRAHGGRGETGAQRGPRDRQGRLYALRQGLHALQAVETRELARPRRAADARPDLPRPARRRRHGRTGRSASRQGVQGDALVMRPAA